jgi:hypothetical protein
MPTAIKTINIIFALSVFLFAVSRFESYKLPDLANILPETFQAPLQSDTDSDTSLNPQREEGKFMYEVQPLFDYELYGLVVSRHESKNDFGMFDHATGGDFLNTSDICVLWGDNLKSRVYQKMVFQNDDWSCAPNFKSGMTREDWQQFQWINGSNNHLLAGNLNVDDVLSQIRPGDQIHLKGKLVKYRKKDSNGPFRISSSMRTDVGNGACEIIYVTSAKILKPANIFWRGLLAVSKWLTIVSGLIAGIYYLRIEDIIREIAGKRVTTASS